MPTASPESYPPLLSLAVHELRTPASVVGGYLRMLQKDADGLSDRHRKMIDEAEKSCTRLVALVAELSDIGKLDSGQGTLNRERLDVFALVADAAGLVQEGRDREVRLEIRGDAGAELMGDRGRLRDALAAVFRAIVREKTGPAIVVVDRRRERKDGSASAIIVIADDTSVQTAYGQPAAPFDERRGGLGLALPLARRVFEAHGGGIWSPQGDKGVTNGSAIVRLPIVA